MSFYWITRLDAINIFLCIVASISGFASILLFIFGLCDMSMAYGKDDKDYINGNKLLRHGIVTMVIAVVTGIAMVFLPTTKEMCAIYMVDYLKDNEKVQKMPEQIIDAASAFLEEQARKGDKK